jgi:pimeloyl-ACP methyl ester carboxylesterase
VQDSAMSIPSISHVALLTLPLLAFASRAANSAVTDSRAAAIATVEDSVLLRAWKNHVQDLQRFWLSEDRDTEVDAISAQSQQKDDHKFEILYYNQTLDHFNRQNDGRFSQRYFVLSAYYKGHGSPIFAYCGGEQGDLYQEWDRYGFVLELAKDAGALVVYMEHRFFGFSAPFGGESFQRGPHRLGLLSVEQSIEDYASILREYKHGGHIVTFGGSLSGSLAALMRVRYPALVDMAYASSAPVMGYPGFADQYAWRARVTENWARYGGDDCPQLVRNGFRVINEGMYNLSTASEDLARAHPGCGGEIGTPADWQKMYGEGWSWLEFYGTNTYHPNAHIFIRDTCQRMRIASAQSTGIGDAAVFKALLFPNWGTALTHGELAQKPGCTNYTALRTTPQAQPQGVGMHGWAYMACTEVVHPIGANNVTDFFPAYDWNTDSLAVGCKQSWGVTPDARFMPEAFGFPVPGYDTEAEAKTMTLNAKSKEPSAPFPKDFEISDSLPGRILFSYGSEDPWTTMGVSKGWRDDVVILTIKGGSHCSDLGTPSAYDTLPMNTSRTRIHETILRWIAALQREHNADLHSFGGAKFPQPGPDGNRSFDGSFMKSVEPIHAAGKKARSLLQTSFRGQ